MSRRTPALIETIRIIDGRAPLFHLHLRRLVASCRALGIPFPTEFKVPEGGPDRVRRLEVGLSGVRESEREVGPAGPVRLRTGTVVHPGYPHKTAERTAFEAAAGETRPDEALLLTAEGLVAEAAIWCLFWWEGDRLCAPALDLGILPGVSRLRVGELAGPVAERRVAPAAIRGLPLFLGNAVRGLIPVSEWDGQRVPEHPGTVALRARFWT